MIERAKIQSIIDSLRGFHRIDESFYEQLDKSFDSQNLYIGVVGKMKAGKSSLVNAVIFGGEKLPTGLAPVTVTLTEISYDEKDNAVVEFITKHDIDELKERAEYKGDDLYMLEKAKAANEVLESLPSEYEKYLGMPSQVINISELRKFVGADGEFSGLAKSVKISMNNENLKGITIIDTPGFNDPITSRGETTKRALQKCHVLLFVHNKDGYDATDKALLTEQIEYAGISEIVDILNKVDLLQGDIEKWPEKLKYFIEQRNKLVLGKESVSQLLKKSNTTYTSSLLALCGLIPYKEMSESMRSQYSSFEEDFMILSQFQNREEQQKAFVKYSNISSIISEINRLAKEGTVYLISGPLMTFRGKLVSVSETNNSEIEDKQSKIKVLNVNIETSRNCLTNFENFINSIMKRVRISSVKTDLVELMNDMIRKMQSFRASKATHEFSEERYPEPDIFSSGVTKANIANYNTFSSEFENYFRNILNDLRDSFITTCKKEINQLILGLADTSQIDKEHMDGLKSSMINEIVNILNEINIVVPSYRINKLPDGKQKQWDKLRDKFLSNYDDEVLCDLKKGPFATFRQTIDSLDYVNIAIRKLDQLKNEIADSINKSPLEKQKEIELITSQIKDLEKENKLIVEYITTIDELCDNIK